MEAVGRNAFSTLMTGCDRDMQEKVDVFLAKKPRYARYTVETVLITTEPAPESTRNRGYLIYLLTSEDLVGQGGRPDRLAAETGSAATMEETLSVEKLREMKRKLDALLERQEGGRK